MVPFNRGALHCSLCMPVAVGTQALEFSSLSRVVWYRIRFTCAYRCAVDPAGFFPPLLFHNLSLGFLSDSLWHQEWNYPTAGSLPGKSSSPPSSSVTFHGWQAVSYLMAFLSFLSPSPQCAGGLSLLWALPRSEACTLCFPRWLWCVSFLWVLCPFIGFSVSKSSLQF